MQSDACRDGRTATLPPELVILPHGVLLLHDTAGCRPGPETGAHPSPPGASGIRVSVADNPVDTACVLLLAWMAGLGILFYLTITGGIASIAPIIVLAIGGVAGFAVWIVFRQLEKSGMRDIDVFAGREGLRWLDARTGKERGRLSLQEMARVDWVRNGNTHSVTVISRSGGCIAPFGDIGNPHRAAWLAWFLHTGLNLELTGNFRLDRIRDALASGTVTEADVEDGETPPTRALDPADGCGKAAKEFRLLRAAADCMPGRPIRIMEKHVRIMEKHDDRLEAVLVRDTRRWTDAIASGVIALLMAGMTAMLLHVYWKSRSGGTSPLLLAAASFLIGAWHVRVLVRGAGKVHQVALGEEWLIDAGESRGGKGWQGQRHAVAAVESRRNNQDPASHDVVIHIAGSQPHPLFLGVDARTGRCLAAILGEWAGSPVLGRASLPPPKSALAAVSESNEKEAVAAITEKPSILSRRPAGP